MEDVREDVDDIMNVSGSIRESIVDILTKHGIPVESDLVYSGMAIRVNNLEVYIWIRVHKKYMADGYIVDVSNVTLPEGKRRQGIFTEMIESIKSNEAVEELWVTSVISEDMMAWCKKHKMQAHNTLDYSYMLRCR